ncbi:MAG: glutathione-disulfide reductase [Sphingomonadaceae bacterium]|uniref:glutathione-disulfide reductase n=1 Tax=Thermaurantiacus sp. TaxID=2820283 RepID=UPI00298F1AA1|nr:glutathione-disulfide reductase [Thermaurantiacus sp.]MCS6987334.1 glutathione-disulfide reductase [Sphingomonadaceae bacterium]MDW8414555.1 glutathione-disulfide reductase [Thermaurantiacus sp.]
MKFDVDLFVIGAGSGGVRAARIAAGHGARVAIAEEYRVGGTCVVRGCVPKKLLVVGAHFAQDLDDAPRFGWRVEAARFDWPTLRDHVLAEVDRLSRLYQSTLDFHGVETIRGRAVLAGPHRVRVGGREITARHVLVATGATPQVPDVPGAELGITSNEVFHLPDLPARVAIVGGGYIACEFAGIFHELGADVVQVLRGPRLLKGWEPALADRLLSLCVARGIEVRLNAAPLRLEPCGRGVRLHLAHGPPVEADLLLWATGRIPKTQGLGLEALGVARGPRGGIIVDDRSTTNLPWLHAVGDVTDRIQLTPVAIREGHALADRLFGGVDRPVDYRFVPSAVFSNPPLASVGLTEPEARDRLGGVRIHTADFRPLKNVLAGREERALFKLVVDAATDRVVGAHLIGPDAPEILQALAIAVRAGITKAELDATVALHPTMAEELVLMR